MEQGGQQDMPHHIRTAADYFEKYLMFKNVGDTVTAKRVFDEEYMPRRQELTDEGKERLDDIIFELLNPGSVPKEDRPAETQQVDPNNPELTALAKAVDDRRIVDEMEKSLKQDTKEEQ